MLTAFAVLLTVAPTGDAAAGVAGGGGEGGGGEEEGLRRAFAEACCSDRSAEQAVNRTTRTMACSWISTCYHSASRHSLLLPHSFVVGQHVSTQKPPAGRQGTSAESSSFLAVQLSGLDNIKAFEHKI